VYAFNQNELKRFSATNKKTYLEKIEDIEILRFIELNMPIKMVKLSSNNFLAVDRPEHAKLISNYLK
jgi:3-deoxy-manno-octulosonate cytidylyltransferase (CMP-KDO synthetase)